MKIRSPPADKCHGVVTSISQPRLSWSRGCRIATEFVSRSTNEASLRGDASVRDTTLSAMPLSFDDQLFIVKSLSLYAVLRGYVTDSEIDREVQELAGRSPGKRFKQAHPNPANARDWLPHYTTAVLALFERKAIPVSAVIGRQLADLRATVASQPSDEERAYYIDDHGIEASVYAEPALKAKVLGQYAGFWRLYRFATGSEASTRVNLSLLNIHSGRQGITSRDGMPWFKLYFEGDSSGHAGPRRAAGAVFPIAERLIFLGQRISANSPFITSMTWPYSDPDRSEVTHRQKSGGLAYLNNSDGDQIASYTIAKFVTGTEAMDEATFRSVRDQETARVRSYAPEELADDLSAADISELTAKSRKLVFTNRDA